MILASPETGLRTTRRMCRGEATAERGGHRLSLCITPSTHPITMIAGLRGRLPEEGVFMSFRTTSAAAMALIAASAAHADDPSLNPVVVTATRQAMRAHELLSDVTVIEREEIAQAGSSSTIAELLARQPGIEMVRSAGPGTSTELRIRGSSQKQVVLLIDGQRVGSATTGEAAWARIPASEIERIEILRGPASFLYGNDAMSGVVQIFTRRGEDGHRLFVEGGAGNYGTFGSSIGVAGAANGWRYNLNTSTFRSDGYDNTRNPRARFANPDRDGYDNTSTSASLSHSWSGGHEIGLNYFNSNGRNHFDSGITTATARMNHELDANVTTWGAYTKNKLSDRWTSTLRAGRSEDDQTSYRNAGIYNIFRTVQNQFGWQNDVRLPLGNLMAAVERLDQTVNGTTAYRVNQRTIDSALLGWSAQIEDHRLQANIRHDRNSQYGSKNIGNLAYGYQITERWRAHASYGTAYRAPSFSELYYPLLSGQEGNPNLLPESARNRDASLHYETRKHRISATYYLNVITDLISWGSRPSPVNIGVARIEGVTLAYSGKLADYDVGASADFADPRDQTTGKVLSRRARQHGTLSIGKKVGAWEARGEMVSSGRRFNEDENTYKLGGYTLFNLYGSYALAPDWSLFARANNIFDKKYEQVLDYATPGASIFVGVRFSPKL